MSTILDQVDNENKSVGDDVDDYVSTISATNISVISRLQVLKNSPQYLAPEIIDDTCSDSKKAEIWSMGIILFGMTTGDLPFGAIERRKSGSPVPARSSFYSFGIPSSSDESATETTKEIMDKILACKKKPYPDWISKPLKVLLSGILVANPHKRYSLYDIKASVWMDGLPGDSELLFDNTSTELTLPPPVKTTERSYFSFIECICDPYSTFTGSSENRKLHNNGSGMDSRSRDSDPVDQVSYKTDSSSSVCAADKSDRGRTGLNGVGSQSYSSRTQNAVYAAQMRRKYFSSEIGSEKEKQAFRDANYYMKEEAKEELQQSEEERDGYGEGEGEQGEGEGDEERGEAERKGGGGGGQGTLKGVNGVLNKDLGPNKGPHSGPRTTSAIIA
jgi:Protein kinase domain